MSWRSCRKSKRVLKLPIVSKASVGFGICVYICALKLRGAEQEQND